MHGKHVAAGSTPVTGSTSPSPAELALELLPLVAAVRLGSRARMALIVVNLNADAPQMAVVTGGKWNVCLWNERKGCWVVPKFALRFERMTVEAVD